MSHREELLEMLGSEQREVLIRDWALGSLKSDQDEQRREGFKRQAESTEQAINRHQKKRDKAATRVAALLAAVNKFPEGEQ